MISTLDKVRKLANYLAINNAEVDPVVEATINKLLAREYNRILELNTRLTDQVSEFENRYHLKSDDFYQRYEAGELGDAMDFIEWAATVEMLKNVRDRLKLLDTVNIQ